VSDATRQYRRHCAVLGLEHVDEMTALNAAYRRLIAQWHPDRHHGSAEHAAASERAKAINAAYAYLSRAIESGTVPSTALAGAPASAHPAPAAWRARSATRSSTSHAGFPDESVLEIFVKSSSIASVGFDSAARLLYVRFHGGTVYKYFDVPPAVIDEILIATSRGAYATSHIIYRYKYEKVA